jgi:non-specific serine/threonine protein kinase
MSVFAGGCTARAVEFVHPGEDAAGDVESLVDKHLVRLEIGADGESRYAQLETIREFGLEQLRASGEGDDAHQRLAAYALERVEALTPELFGLGQAAASQGLLAEHNNIRAALDWCVAAHRPETIRLGLRMAGALWLFWRVRGFVGEGRGRLQALLGAAGAASAPSTELGRALHAGGYLAFALGEAEAAQALLSAALEMGRHVSDAWTQSYALHGLGHAALLRGDLQQARALYGDRLAIARAQDDEYALGQALNALGEVARYLDERGVARRYYEQSIAFRRRLGDARGVAMGLSNVGLVAAAEGETGRARELLSEALALLEQLGNPYGEAVAISALAAVAAADGDHDCAARLLGASAAILERLGNPLEPADRLAQQRTEELARRALGSAFEAAYGAGRSLSPTEAKRLGLATRAVAAPREEPSPRVLAPGVAGLSPREREVVRLIAAGRTSEEIAEALVISPRTADTHAAHIRDKLGLRSRAEIAAWGIRHGLD